MQPRRLLLIEKSINLVSMSSHLTLRNKHRCISISSCYSTRVLSSNVLLGLLGVITVAEMIGTESVHTRQ